MIRHYRDYEFDEAQKDQPPFERHARTLCGKDLHPVLASSEETLAFWWCPPEKVACAGCLEGRLRLKAKGTWPEEKHS